MIACVWLVPPKFCSTPLRWLRWLDRSEGLQPAAPLAAPPVERNEEELSTVPGFVPGMNQTGQWDAARLRPVYRAPRSFTRSSSLYLFAPAQQRQLWRRNSGI